MGFTYITMDVVGIPDSQYETALEKYGMGGTRKKKFGVSTQHYSFAVKAFVDMAKEKTIRFEQLNGYPCLFFEQVR